MTPIAWVLAAYFAGSIPTSYVVGKSFGVDLRREGSGNLGATNVYRTMGLRTAVPVGLVDVAKGWFPAWAFPLLDGAAASGWAAAYGAAAILGHTFSCWVRFRGGKGVATARARSSRCRLCPCSPRWWSGCWSSRRAVSFRSLRLPPRPRFPPP